MDNHVCVGITRMISRFRPAPMPWACSRVWRCYNKGTNPMNHEAWPVHFTWFQEKLEAFDRVFRHRIRNLNAGDWDDEEMSAEDE